MKKYFFNNYKKIFILIFVLASIFTLFSFVFSSKKFSISKSLNPQKIFKPYFGSNSNGKNLEGGVRLISGSNLRGENNFTAKFYGSVLAEAVKKNMETKDQLETFKNLDSSEIVKNFINLINPNLKSLTKEEIEKSDLNIVSDNSRTAIFSYLNQVFKINKKIFSPLAGLVLPAYQNAMKNNFSGFKPLAGAYGNAFEEMKKIPVPSGWVDWHLNILKLFSSMKQSYEILSSSDEDKIKSLIILKNTLSLNNRLKSLRNELFQKAQRELR